MGNHKTIRAALGCSGRAGSQNPGSNCALHPGAPGSSRTGRRAARTGTATAEDRAGDRGGGQRVEEGDGARAAAHRGGRRPPTTPPTARAPHPLPSSTHHAVLTTLKRKEEPLRCRPPLSSHPHGPHWRHGSREAAAVDSKIRPLSPRAMLIGALGQSLLHRLEPRGQC